MTMTDPVSDYLTRVRNAILAKHKKVDIPTSGLKLALTKVLLDQQFIAGFKQVSDTHQGTIRIQLRYTDGKPAILGLRRVSKPGLRRYVGMDDIPRVLGGLGVAILSTPRGLMTDKEARHARIGGELLCEIW